MIKGRVLDLQGNPLAGANVVIGSGFGGNSGQNGSFRFTVRADAFEGKPALIKSRRIGYTPTATELLVEGADSVELEFRNCRDVETLLMTVVTGLGDPEREDGTRLDSETDLDGGAVSVDGNFLVVLNRGRLFSVSTKGGNLDPVSVVDAFGPGLDPRYSYQAQVFVSGRDIVVAGSSNRYGGIELSSFHLSETGALIYSSTYQLRYAQDMYVSVAEPVRFQGGRLIIHSQVDLPEDTAKLESSLPAVRKWRVGAGDDEFKPMLRPLDVYRPARALTEVDKPVLQTVTICNVIRGEFACHASAIVSTMAREVYTSENATYVWPNLPSQPVRKRGGMVVYRFPLAGGQPLGLGVDGNPAASDALFEEHGFLNAVLRSGPTGQWATSDLQQGNIFSLRVPISEFDRVASTAADTRYSQLGRLPVEPTSVAFTPEFLTVAMGRKAMAGRRARDTITSSTFEATTSDRFEAPGEVEGIDAIGGKTIASILSGKRLRFKMVDPMRGQHNRDVSTVAGRVAQVDNLLNNDGSALAAYVIRRSGKSELDELHDGGASVLFMRMTPAGLDHVGEIFAHTPTNVEDDCKSSCLDWYGDARTIFVNGRIFVVLGYELIEARVVGGKLVEKERINFLK